MATIPKFALHYDAARAGWFSRRHQTSAAHCEAGVEFLDRRRAQKDAAVARAAVVRTPLEQLRRLDERLGACQGAERERARLKAKLAGPSKGLAKK